MESKFDIEVVRDNLRRLMEERDIAPTTLSQKIGNSKTVVREILEANLDVKLGTLYRLATVLEVDINELISPHGEVVPLFVRQQWRRLSPDDQDRVAKFVNALLPE